MVKIQQKRIDAHINSIDMDSEIEQAMSKKDEYTDNTKNKVNDLLDN